MKAVELRTRPLRRVGERPRTSDGELALETDDLESGRSASPSPCCFAGIATSSRSDHLPAQRCSANPVDVSSARAAAPIRKEWLAVATDESRASAAEPGGLLTASDRRTHAPDASVPASLRSEDPVLARLRQTSTVHAGPSDHPTAPTGTSAWPRTQPSARGRADDCIPLTMRKSNRAR